MRLATLAVTPNPVRLGYATDFAVVVDEYDGDGPIEVCLGVAPPVSFGAHNMLCQTVMGSAPTIVTFRAKIRSNERAQQIMVHVLAGNGVANAELRDTLAVDSDDEPFSCC